MKITHVNIRHFLGLESLDLHLQAPVNLVVGPNEAGKSSVRDAVLWCLTGQARGLKTHQEQAALIRDGGKAAEVSITLDDGRTIARRKTPKTPAAASGDSEQLPGISPAILCDPFTFLDWPETARRELLFKLIPGLTPTTEGIASRLLNHLHPGKEKTVGLDSAEFEAIDRLAALAAKQGFPQAEKEAVAMRREAKRLKESLAQAKEPEPKLTLGERAYVISDVDRDAVAAALKDLQEKRDALLKAKGRREADSDRAAAIEKELAALKAQLPDPPRKGLREEWLEEVDTLAPEREKIQSALEALGKKESFPDICPVIRSTQIPCPKAGEKIGGPADPAEVQELQGKLAEIEKALDEAMVNLTDVEAQGKLHKAVTDKIAKLEKELAGLQKEDLSDDTDEQVAALDRRLDNGRALLHAVQKFWTEKEWADQAKAQLEAAEKEIALYDALAKALAPDGIPSQMIAEALGPVNDLLAVASAQLFPGRDLALTGDLDIELSGSPFATLSKSARFRVGVAFQYVLAKLAGERLLLIDEADILDPLNRAALTDFLLSIREDFDTIMVFATSSQAHASPYPDIQVWWLAAGRIAPVVQKAA
jgi:DNA repair exonuclease SbcCD ATPase subunit